MKVLFAGLKYDYGIEERGPSLEIKVLIPAIKDASDHTDVFFLEENGFPNDIDQLQRNLITFADKVKPDIVFFALMKDEIQKATLKYLSDRYITTNWFCDDTWRFDDFSSTIAPLLTVSITNDKFSLNKYKAIGCEALLTQWATLDYDENLDLEHVNYKYDISFVGAKNPAREWIVEELKNKNLTVHCFGAGWENGRISFEEMKDIFYTSKINLNLSNSVPTNINFLRYAVRNLFKSTTQIFRYSFMQYLRNINGYVRAVRFFFRAAKTAEQMKARNFEICGWGGFQLGQYALELEDYYNIGSEIAIFTNPKELVTQCNYYLDNEDLRKKICANGHRRTKAYNYVDRLRELFVALRKIRDEANKN